LDAREEEAQFQEGAGVWARSIGSTCRIALDCVPEQSVTVTGRQSPENEWTPN